VPVVRILIINLHSSRNAGDAALAFAAVQQLHDAFPDSTVTLSLNDPASHPDSDPKVGSFMHWFHTLSANGKPRWRIGEIIRLGVSSLVAVTTYRWRKRPVFPFLSKEQKTFLQAYFDADLVASAPGNFLYSSGKVGLSFLSAIYAMAFAVWAGKPLYLLPQSIGPLKRNWERWLIRWVLNRARLVMVREEVSLQQIRQARVANPHVRLQPDMAFSFAAASSEVAIRWLQSHGINTDREVPLLGVTAINWGAQTGQHALQTQYESALAETVRYFIEQIRGKVIFFPQVAGATASADDRLPARRVIDSLIDIKEHVTLIDAPPSPAVLKAAYGLMNIFIGTRMHSNIFALCGGVPVLAIAYRHKTQGIMHMLGLDEWSIDIQAASGSALTERVSALWEQRETVREHIQQVLPSVVEASQHAGNLIAEDFASLNPNSLLHSE
jgi:colanic acid/amylovoran biosynthesis protein